MLKNFCIALSICFLLAEQAVSETFFLRGDITLEPGIQKIPQSFTIRKFSDPSSVTIPFSDTYQKRLSISDYVNTEIFFDFPFGGSAPPLSFDEYKVKIPSGLITGAHVQKDFSFFRPETFARQLVRKVSDVARRDDCDEFFLLSDRLFELSEISPTSFAPTKPRFAQVLSASNTLLRKVFEHSCSLNKLQTALDCQLNLIHKTEFKDLPPWRRLRVANDLSYTFQFHRARNDQERSFFERAANTISEIILVPDILDVEDDSIPDLAFAITNYFVKSKKYGKAEKSVKNALAISAVIDDRTIRGSLLFEYFMIISEARLIDEGRDIVFDGTLPSSEYFSEILSTEKSKWCYLLNEFEKDPRMKRDWVREGRRTSMRREMNALKEANICGEI